ncbi:LOB domain-containing protein 30-like [Cornus florida]|uniref:LOB domain-containing protein 30-like n=1 Tax=Cornus florida TaxID=4283 RepID=UPI0028A16CAC|nr:LOB domain-containing protein 30-like [Cornus florida]
MASRNLYMKFASSRASKLFYVVFKSSSKPNKPNSTNDTHPSLSLDSLLQDPSLALKMMNANSGMSSGANGGGSGTGPCGGCKYLRKKCSPECLFAPYFDSAEVGVSHFRAVHKVFGTSNFAKLLEKIPVQRRLIVVVTMCYEAEARLQEPVYGAVAKMLSLQREVSNLKMEILNLQARLELSYMQPPPPPQTPLSLSEGIPLGSPPLPPPPPQTPPSLSEDIPLGSSMFTSYDPSSFFEPIGQSSGTIPPEDDPIRPPTSSVLEAIARELLGDEETDPMY